MCMHANALAEPCALRVAQVWRALHYMPYMCICCRYGGGSAERALYRAFPLTRGWDYGPPRLPRRPFDEADWPALHRELAAQRFWDQLVPP